MRQGAAGPRTRFQRRGPSRAELARRPDRQAGGEGSASSHRRASSNRPVPRRQVGQAQPDAVVVGSGSCRRLENGLSLLDGNGIGGIESHKLLDGSDPVVATPALANETTSLVVPSLKLVKVDESLPGFFAEIAGSSRAAGKSGSAAESR